MNTNAKPKKETKKTKTQSSDAETFGELKSKDELKGFLVGIRDKMTEQVAAPLYAMSAMNFVLNLPNIYDLLDNENKEIARDIWLRVKQAGMQVRNPPMLFQPEEETLGKSL